MAYHGVKFGTKFEHETFQNIAQMDELKSWCNIFAKNGLAPSHPSGTFGNLSIRYGNAIIITATSLDLGKSLYHSDFVLVQDCNFESFEIIVSGNKPPSSETPVHWSLYQLRPDINAIFHGHHDKLLKYTDILNIPETDTEQPYGSLALVEEVNKLSSHNFFNMINHGFISMGKTTQDAGNLALKYLLKLNQME